MSHNDVQVPHLAYPFHFGRDGSAAVLEQDSIDEITQCVEVFLRTEEGQRVELPDYGIPGFVFVDEIDTEFLTTMVEEWEPRARVLFEEGYDRTDELTRVLTTHVEGR